jgi:hypothetical protein
MWKESCRLKDAQIADLESNLDSANAMLDDARCEVRELQRRCVEGDHKLSALLATEKLAREELQGKVKTARAEVGPIAFGCLFTSPMACCCGCARLSRASMLSWHGCPSWATWRHREQVPQMYPPVNTGAGPTRRGWPAKSKRFSLRNAPSIRQLIYQSLWTLRTRPGSQMRHAQTAGSCHDIQCTADCTIE